MTQGATTSAPVKIETAGRVAIIRMTAPSNHNALNVAMREALMDAIRTVNESAGLDGMVLTGNERTFCAGGDLRTMGQMTHAEGVSRIIGAQALPRSIHASPKPVVAAVEGICAGAGMALAAVCDLIVVGRGARFITSFEKVGLMPDLGASCSVTARMGCQAARRLFLLGGSLGAEEAQDSGLSDFLVEKGHAEVAATELVGRLSRLAPGARHAVREVFRDPPATLEDAFRFEIAHQPGLYVSSDLQEGVAAFLEKREPNWRDV